MFLLWTGTFNILINIASANTFSLQVGYSGSIPIYKKCLKDTVTKSSSELTLLEDIQTEWDELCTRLEELLLALNVDNLYCNTPIEPKKVNL